MAQMRGQPARRLDAVPARLRVDAGALPRSILALGVLHRRGVKRVVCVLRRRVQLGCINAIPAPSRPSEQVDASLDPRGHADAHMCRGNTDSSPSCGCFPGGGDGPPSWERRRRGGSQKGAPPGQPARPRGLRAKQPHVHQRRRGSRASETGKGACIRKENRN